MRILMLLDGSYPNDIRVRKEAELLAKHHDIFVLCQTVDNSPKNETINGVHVVRKFGYKSKIVKGVVDVFTSISFFNPFLSTLISNCIKEMNIEAVHVHDLPLAKTAYLAAKKHGIKTVLDLHENYPAALMTWFTWRKSPIVRLKNRLFFGYGRWLKYESQIIKKFDVIIAVVNEMKERLVRQHKIAEHKISVVPNAEKKSFADNFKKSTYRYFQDYHDRFIISYVGGFGPHRGLHTAINGMKWIIKKIPNALLVLVGPSNKDVRDYLQGLIISNDLGDFVEIRDSEPFSKVISIMSSSDVNIIPHISNEHTESAVPHKFYQILMSRKPLLVSSCAPMVRIIEENNIGTWFEAENPQSFAKKICEIEGNYSEALEKSERGYYLSFNGNLNWEFMSKELLTLYDNLSH